jgi:general secretion pathway protein G
MNYRYRSIEMRNTNMLLTGHRRNGFTLIELLVVLVILGLLASLVGPRVMQQLGSSKTKTARLQIEEFGAALDLFRLELGRYPTTDEGLVALVENPGVMPGWHGPYLRKKVIRFDPWGWEYEYRYPGENDEYDLFTLGADNTPGGEDENRDVVSWE